MLIRRSQARRRFVITCAPERAAELEAVFRGLPCARVGTVTEPRRLLLRRGGQEVVAAESDALRDAFTGTLRE